MGPHEEAVREEMARDADIMRGLGGSGLPSLADMRYYSTALSEAALMDHPPLDEADYEPPEYREWCREVNEQHRLECDAAEFLSGLRAL